MSIGGRRIGKSSRLIPLPSTCPLLHPSTLQVIPPSHLPVLPSHNPSLSHAFDPPPHWVGQASLACPCIAAKPSWQTDVSLLWTSVDHDLVVDVEATTLPTLSILRQVQPFVGIVVVQVSDSTLGPGPCALVQYMSSTIPIHSSVPPRVPLYTHPTVEGVFLCVHPCRRCGCIALLLPSIRHPSAVLTLLCPKHTSSSHVTSKPMFRCSMPLSPVSIRIWAGANSM
jgi:hypothetical protein